MKKTERAISRGYAESLYGLAEIEGIVDKLESEFFELKKVLEKNYELREFLSNPKILAKQKKKALEELLSPTTSSLFRNELFILIDENRAHLMLEVAEEFIKLVKEKKNRLLAEVITAVPITPEIEKKITSKLSKLTGKKVSVKNIVDENIFGGLVIKIEGKILDLSVRKKLADLKEQMILTGKGAS